MTVEHLNGSPDASLYKHRSMPRPLYFMVKPPPDVATAIAALPQAGSRAPDLLHMTLLPLGDRLRRAADTLDYAIAVGDAIEAAPFRLIFDRVTGSGRTLALRGSEPIRGAISFQSMLIEMMIRHGLPFPRYRFSPHITIDYRSAFRGTVAIDPISWLAEEFLLIESVVGEGRHIEHGRWPLR